MKNIKEFALTPEPSESAYIKYRLELADTTSTEIARYFDVNPSVVQNVIAGRRHSVRIEQRIAQVIGFPSWNAMIKSIRTQVA